MTDHGDIDVYSLDDQRVYIYYDGPRFFSGVWTDRERYLVIEIAEDDDTYESTWLIGRESILDPPLLEMESGEITARECIARLFELRIQNNSTVRFVTFDELTDDQLPTVDARFPRRSET